MSRPNQPRSLNFVARLRTALAVLASSLTAVLTLATTPPAQAQTHNYRLLYSFTGGEDGSFPVAGLTMDSAGNLYGTTAGIPDWAPWPLATSRHQAGARAVLSSNLSQQLPAGALQPCTVSKRRAPLNEGGIYCVGQFVIHRGTETPRKPRFVDFPFAEIASCG